jgi:hypothetical protein
MSEGGMYSGWVDKQSAGKMSHAESRTRRNVIGILLTRAPTLDVRPLGSNGIQIFIRQDKNFDQF